MVWRALSFLLGQAKCRRSPSGALGSQLSIASSRKVPMFGLEAIWRNGQVVGHVRRADFGFTINKTLAYGYIQDPSGGPVSPPRPRSCPHTATGSPSPLWGSPQHPCLPLWVGWAWGDQRTVRGLTDGACLPQA